MSDWFNAKDKRLCIQWQHITVQYNILVVKHKTGATDT